MNTSTRFAALALGALALGLATSTPAQAQQPSFRFDAPTTHGLRREVVRFADLDLTQPSGLQVLHRRLRGAATRVCADDAPDARLRWRAQQACIQGALHQAVNAVGQLQLTAPGRAALVAMLERR